MSKLFGVECSVIGEIFIAKTILKLFLKEKGVRILAGSNWLKMDSKVGSMNMCVNLRIA